MAIETDNRVGDSSYYLKEANQLPTEFRGKLAQILGIDGTFDPAVYDRLMRGMEPEMVNGKEAKLTMRLDKNRTMADDWTFNRPKSVSAAKLVAGDHRIDAVETRAELAAMKLIEDQATVKVRKKSELEKTPKIKGWKYPERKTNNLLWIAFRHPSSRAVDPASHTHFVIMNLSFDKVERRVKAVCLKHVDRKAAGELYEKEMRKGLNELGYKTRTVGNSWEISGFPAEVKAIYSQRGEQIEGIKQKYPKAGGKVSVIDRPEKQDDQPLEERRKGWISRITDSQLQHLHEMVRKAKRAVRSKVQTARMQKFVAKTIQPVLEPEQQHDRGFER